MRLHVRKCLESQPSFDPENWVNTVIDAHFSETEDKEARLWYSLNMSNQVRLAVGSPTGEEAIFPDGGM